MSPTQLRIIAGGLYRENFHQAVMQNGRSGRRRCTVGPSGPGLPGGAGGHGGLPRRGMTEEDVAQEANAAQLGSTSKVPCSSCWFQISLSEIQLSAHLWP